MLGDTTEVLGSLAPARPVKSTPTERQRCMTPENTRRTAAVIYNPVKVDIDELRAAVDSEASAAGWAETSWYETSVEDVGQGVTKQAIADGADMIIAAGGDGTVRAIAEAVRGTGASVALLPSGTGNLLARNLELTLDDMPESVRQPSPASIGPSISV